MNSSLVFLLAFAIGLVTGLRSLTGPALVCWAAHLGWLNLEGSRVEFMQSTLATYGFSALALGELVADKLPFIPSRTSPGPLFGRVVLGALSGRRSAWPAATPPPSAQSSADWAARWERLRDIKHAWVW